MRVIISSILLLISALAIGQPSAKERKENAEKKASAERQRSLGGQITENELKDQGVAPQTPGDSVKGSMQAPTNNRSVISSNKDQPQTDRAEAQKSNAPAVIQSTTSESGSPSVLSGENGSGRDGTNNVQRAKANIAGAEVPADMNLEKRNTQSSKAASNGTRIRKEEEQPAHITRDGTENANPKVNAASKDGVSPGGKEEKQTKKEKARKKSRRNKEKASGK
jgi:hypothetical protein